LSDDAPVDTGSPYAAPRAPVGEAPVERGSLLLGFFLGWLALFAGGLLLLAWFMVMIIFAAMEPESFEVVWPLGTVAVPMTPLALAYRFWRRGRTDTASGIVMALAIALVLGGALAVAYWPY
jgi:uncharacterized membrane protein YfcA